MEPEEKGRGSIFSLEAGRTWQQGTGEGDFVPCGAIGYLCNSFVFGGVTLRKDLLPQREPSSSFSKGPRPIEITYGAKVVL